jgi:signal transduction histidine kinase
VEGGAGFVRTSDDEDRRATAERLAQDLDAMRRLHRLSTRFVRAGDLPQTVLQEIVEAAISITHADMGNIQLLDPASRRLRIAAHRGHEQWWLDFFESVAEGEGASCAAALKQEARVIVEDVTRSPVFVGTPSLEVQLRAGVRAVQSTPLLGSSGDLVGMISTHYRTPRRPDERDLRLLDLLARQAADMIERVRSEERLAADLAALTRLHALSRRVVETSTIEPLLQDTMDAAVAIVRADKGTLQLLEGDALRIVAHAGHDQAFLDFFAEAGDVASVCGEATRRGERVLVPDVVTSPLFAGTASLPVLRAAGVRAVQSTPMRTRAGRLLGVLTTHWGEPHTPDEHDLWRLDLLARQAADSLEQKQAEEALRASEARYRRLFQNMLEGFAFCQMIFDAGGRAADFVYLEVNGSFEPLTGLRDVVGKRVSEVVPGIWSAHPELLETFGRVARTGSAERFELDFRPLDASFSVSVYGAQPDRFVAIFDNITERKRAERALREADRRKDEFLALLGHELRNPLAPIRNSANILEHADPDSEQAARARRVLRRQSDHLARLVDDLLDVTRITRGKISLQRSRLDLREATVRAAEDCRLMMADRGIAFRLVLPDVEAWADADATRVNQVITNLLHNAAKFTPRGGEVVVSLRQEGGRAELRVHDTGAGIDPALFTHLFEVFVQGERTLARSEGGLGLGLALVKGIVELHGGEVRAESAGAGKGADFVVLLPIQDPSAAARGEDAPERSEHGGRRVLVVDDNVDAAESLADLLRLDGHAVEVAFDGPSALTKLETTSPDVILCDIGMPGMSGYDLAKTIRARGGRGMQLVALTGYAQAEDVQRAKDAGFDAHVAKPPEPKELQRLLA